MGDVAPFPVGKSSSITSRLNTPVSPVQEWFLKGVRDHVVSGYQGLVICRRQTRRLRGASWLEARLLLAARSTGLKARAPISKHLHTQTDVKWQRINGVFMPTILRPKPFARPSMHMQPAVPNPSNPYSP